MREETELYAKAVKLWGEQAQEMVTTPSAKADGFSRDTAKAQSAPENIS